MKLFPIIVALGVALSLTACVTDGGLDPDDVQVHRHGGSNGSGDGKTWQDKAFTKGGGGGGRG